MKYLLFNLCFILIACASDYKTLKPITPDQNCIMQQMPRGMYTAWYDASVTIMGKHISGLLLIKNMPDNTRRIVFTNEAGITFFDFEFRADGTFAVKHCIKQLDRKPVIKTLQKDFALMLGIPFQQGHIKAWESDNEIFYGTTQKKETAYFITDKDCASLQRMEMGSRRTRKVATVLAGEHSQAPDSVLISHHTFQMVINLKKLERP